MRLTLPVLLLALVLAAGSAAAQDAGSAYSENDCEFLEQSFQEVYDGLRQRGANLHEADPGLATMFVAIQNNIILLHQARGCNIGVLIDLARQEAERYAERRR